jgi:hypothetical protein
MLCKCITTNSPSFNVFSVVSRKEIMLCCCILSNDYMMYKSQVVRW